MSEAQATGAYAVLFPGQGSQAVGMGMALAEAFPEAAEVLRRADRVVPGLLRLIEQGPEAQLRQTAYTQPALLAVCVATWEVWRRRAGPAGPAAGAGHSLGEYSALVAAGALGLEEGVALVRARGQAMAEALPAGEGGMGAVLGLEDEQVVAICREVARELGDEAAVVAANFNAPGQVVVSGRTAALEAVRTRVQRAGGRWADLAVSGPFHSPLMAGAARRLREALREVRWQAPAWPVIANVDARPYPQRADAIGAALEAQLVSPVRWAESLRTMAAMGVTHFVELGPGRVLSGTVRRTLPGAVALNVQDPASLEASLARLKGDGLI